MPCVVSRSTEAEVRTIPIALLVPGRYRARAQSSRVRLEQLVESIRATGVIQPLLVRPSTQNRFEVLAGNRRWYAAKQLQLAELPCLVRHYSDLQAAQIGLVENLMRENLGPIDVATALKRQIDEFGLTQKEVATALGVTQSHISHKLRLLKLHDDVKRMLNSGHLTVGHAKVLTSLPQDQQLVLARQVAREDWSVRRLECHAKVRQASVAERARAKPTIVSNEAIRDFVHRTGLSARLVENDTETGVGRIEIHYLNRVQRDELVELLGTYKSQTASVEATGNRCSSRMLRKAASGS